MAGFDCLWIDQEHQALDWSTLAAHIWAAKSQDTDTMIRVARGSYSDYIRPLELDATGILVPHIMSLADAKAVVEMTKFHPIGRRPIDGGNADGAYTKYDMLPYMEYANKQRFVVLQIEDPEPLADLDAIAALDGVDMLFFGPADFSQGIGAPGQWDHPLLLEARKNVAAAARKFGKYAATVGGPGNAKELRELGYQFINMGADVVGVRSYFEGLVKAFKEGQSTAHDDSYYKK